VFFQSIREVTQSQVVIISNKTIWEVQTIFIGSKASISSKLYADKSSPLQISLYCKLVWVNSQFSWTIIHKFIIW